jgi:hypothetical protein
MYANQNTDAKYRHKQTVTLSQLQRAPKHVYEFQLASKFEGKLLVFLWGAVTHLV